MSRRTTILHVVALAVLALLAPIVPVLLAQAPAGAATECRIREDIVTTRSCNYLTNIKGARIKGFADWTYQGEDGGGPEIQKTGSANGVIYDTIADDNLCVQAKITFRSRTYPEDNETQYFRACDGRQSNFNVTLNQGRSYNSGSYAIFVCRHKKHCKKVWQQNINASAP